MALITAASATAARAVAAAGQLADDYIALETRDASPAHFLFKIESCSLLQNCEIDKYETNDFLAGEHKWKLIIYPNGEDKEKDCDYISIYLAMGDTSSMPANWEVNAVFSIFLYNQIHDNYLYSLGITRRFLGVKPQWGFSKFISKKFLTDSSNGYLVNDSCVFGAEVYVVKKEAFTTECLSLKNFEIPYKRDWKIPNFSKLGHVWDSEQFSAGGHKWIVRLYPKGYGEASGRHVSVYLYYCCSNTGTPSERVQAHRTICIKNQLHDQHHEFTSTVWYVGSNDNWGWPSFIEIATINDPKKGFIVNDSCLLEVEISVKAVVQVSP
ncbi:hypothetical protein ABFS82_07G096600 [Erythranthe guttata]|uniref:MATH domain-containing protein n=1 Tax=Erythranthe guttata TaxID=4155 RepID=A0A022RLT1_ERYGU|nr:hypothetical protein MIMGU_mgv1a021538mg [Erythranthe guttata]